MRSTPILRTAVMLGVIVGLFAASTALGNLFSSCLVQASYSQTGTSYRTLDVGSGKKTYAVATVTVGGESGAQGGGAVTKAKCGNDDLTVPGCVSGTVAGGPGATGEVLIAVSDNGCKRAMEKCSKIVVTLRNGDTVTIETPGVLAMARLELPGKVGQLPPTPYFGSVVGVVGVSGGPGGITVGGGVSTPSDLDEGVTALSYDGYLDAEVTTSGPTGPLAVLGNGTLTDRVKVTKGSYVVVLDTAGVPPGALVTVRLKASDLDVGIASAKIE